MEDIIVEFKEWLGSEKAAKQRKTIEEEKYQVRELMQKLETMDKKSSEFMDMVLYGLLPYRKSKFAKRVSTFPVFMNIKQFLGRYDYNDGDWNKIANMVYDLASKLQNEPSKLEWWIKEFIADKKHSRMLQCGTISPILFCINDLFPVINSKVINTYGDFSQKFGWNDEIPLKLENYVDSIKKCKKLIDAIGIVEVKDMAVFDLFCWWYDGIRKSEDTNETSEEDEHEGISKTVPEDVSYEQFLPSVDPEVLGRPEPNVLRSPERIKVKELLHACQNGKWQLPDFQRYFDWKKTDIRDLLESIFRDFYIGSLLLWDVDREIPLKLIPIHGVKQPDDDVRTDMIILDGQQRITSLYYAIRGVKEPTKHIKKPVYFYINFERFLTGHEEGNIEILEQKLSREETIKKLCFPFYELEKYYAWIDAFEDYAGSNGNYDRVKSIRRFMEKKLRYFIEEFEIPYVVLPHTVKLPQMADIFERINTRGKALSVFDILIATLSKYDINLRRLWDDTKKNFPKMTEYNARDKLPIYILQSIALANHDLSLCGRKDLLKIYNTVIGPKDLSFEQIWGEMAQWVDRAIRKLENMRDGYGVRNRKSLPYLPTIPILAALLRAIDSRADKFDCNAKLDMWYWSSVFSEMYSSAVDTKLTADYREMLGWFDDESKTLRSVERFRREFHATINLHEIKRENNAVYRGILSLFALKGAPDFDTGLTLDNAPENDKHHIFPKKSFGSFNNVNSILNLTWLSDKTNRNIVGAKKPSLYIKTFLQEKYNDDEGKLLEILEKHYISKKGYESMLRDDFDGFVAEREKTILSRIARLVGIEKDEQPGSTMIAPTTPFSNETAILNTIKECDDYIEWVDLYFSRKGLEWLLCALGNQSVKTVKIITAKNSQDPKKISLLRESFKKFRSEMEKKGITCELRVLTNRKTASNIHDRWIVTKDTAYNIPSTDVIARGQFSEIKRNVQKPDFENWWDNSLDIINDWPKIIGHGDDDK